MSETSSPFHAGELEAQRRAGVGDVAAWASGFIRGYLPEQHRAFHTALPFLVLSASDGEGRIWTTLLEGADGFVASPDPETLTLATTLDPQDPLAGSLGAGTEIGMLGIELATRRRNRLSGVFRPDGAGFAIDVRQTFGNCPQYIREREWHRVPTRDRGAAGRDSSLNADQIARIGLADTLFIGTGQQGVEGHASNGYDASHRGGEPGFVQVVDARRLRIPDYAGNNFFNTIGNLLENPRVGLLFVDFETGGLLQISGRAVVDWAPDAADPAARRMIEVEIEAVVDRPAALALRWQAESAPVHRLAVTRKVVEAEGITSFYLSPADGRPVAPFEAGQHLPIELAVPGQSAKVRRTYSLSGAPRAAGYRLSIKREDQGLASRFLHDAVEVGHVIEARRPSGDFVIPCGKCPLVLASAGIGITPMLAMLHAAAGEATARPVWFVHGARDGRHHVLREEVDGLVADRPHVAHQVLYSRPSEDDRLGEDYHAAGRLTAETLLRLNAGPGAHYMLCGPARFIADLRDGLESGGVPAAQIHFETFGPTG
ncbi:MAG: pyridoxamine 5'-phosphate oxidase family protein [Pseudomonadota bacterium]